MLKKLFFNILILIVLIGCDTEESLTQFNDEYFIKYYGGDGDQEGVDVIQLADGGFILLGNSIKSGDISNLFLVRTDGQGNEIWSNTFGGNQNVRAGGLAIDGNEDFVIGATIDEIFEGSTDAIIYRVNPEGNKIDSAVYGTLGSNEVINDILITSANEIIIVGSTEDIDILKPGTSSSDLLDIYSVKVGSDLVPVLPNLWRQVYGFEGIDIGQQIIERQDGSFVFFGSSDDVNSNDQKAGFNMFLFPTNSEGFTSNLFETQYYGTLNDEYASQIVNTLDGGYAMIGRSENANGQNGIYMARVRRNFNILNEQNITSGEDIEGFSIAETAGGFLILGVKNNTTGSGDIYLSKVSSFFDLIWPSAKTYGGIDNDKASKLIELLDGGIGIVGTIELESQTKMCLIKTNSLGTLKP
jgi:hypothetical protein